MKKKERLDNLVQQVYPDMSKTQIQSLIMQGKVHVDGTVVNKAGTAVSIDTEIHVNYEVPKFVCRAGFKLEKALDFFHIDVKGYTVLDAGLSTGGFTDCLLQHGALHVYGVDVGYGQVHEKISSDQRVTVMERTNLRYLKELPTLVDLVTLDLSFISVLKVIEAVSQLMKPSAQLIILVKPQFEAEKKDVGKGGIIKDSQVHQRVIDTVVVGISAQGFEYKGITESPIYGTMGNKEFLAYFIKER